LVLLPIFNKNSEEENEEVKFMTNDFSLYVPIAKVNLEKRTVAGWATTEEIDKQNEIVDYAGSRDAFANWQGNIREMHEPKAVGKAVEIIPNDPDKKVWVEAYISKGAEDTWQKVKEGILTGFSIGGQTMHKTTQIVKDMTTGGSRTVSRITKYRLNELSLVDNPANPGCSFTLVKSVDGVPFQTEIVEDIKKFVITEAEDPLKSEIDEHRSKADSLIKKVLDRDELDKLGDDHFGIIRKSERNGVITKERLIPMPDKVHAVRALEILDKYNLSVEENETIHKKAQEILGAAYDTYNQNRGGENKVSKEAIDKLTEVITGLVKRLDSLEKSFEGAFKPVPGAKEVPSEATYKPELGESAPAKAGAADDVQTQDPDGAYPAKGPVKATEATDVEKAKNPATSSLKTQEENAIPVKKETVEKAKNVATSSCETQDPKGAYPAKGPIKAEGCPEESEEHEAAETPEEEKEEAKKPFYAKSEGSENDLSKVVSAVDSLRKRFDDVEKKLSQPMPRKIKVEKNLSETHGQDAEFQRQAEEVKKWVASGKTLTAEQEKVRDGVLNKMLDGKFGKSL